MRDAGLLEVEESEVVERFYAEGWTDGLPIVAPTPERVAAMLHGAGLDAADVIGTAPERHRAITAEKAAVNAVMAGCRSAYFPIVVAALRAMCDPAFNAHTVCTSTGGAALCAVVSGPLAAEVGMNARHNILGPGNRANATIGRSLRLVARNVLGAVSPGLDGTSIGHGGKFTMCFAEDPPPPPWEPLRVALGYDAGGTTVSVFPVEGPHQVANQLNPSSEGVLRTFARAMRNPVTFAVGKRHQVLIVLGPEHADAIIGDGWSRRACQEYLAVHSRISPDELEDAGVLIESGAQHDMSTGADGRITVAEPDDIFLVTAGGAGAGWSAYIPVWAPTQHARAATRAVTVAGEALPDCGRDGCEIDWERLGVPGSGGR